MTTTTSPQKSKRTTWAWLTATFFGTGYLKPGPGTYGSVATVALWLLINHIFPESPLHTTLHTILAAIVVTLIGIPAATRVARESGRKDPQFVVIDEVAGQLITLAVCPADWKHALLALLLFRTFDITKPPPVRQIERLPEGTGILLDDVAAGLYALFVFQVIHIWF